MADSFPEPDLEKFIRKLVLAAVAAHASTPAFDVQFENQPDERDPNATSIGPPWVFARIAYGPMAHGDIGSPTNRRWRRTGLVSFEIYTAAGDTAEPGTKMRDHLLQGGFRGTTHTDDVTGGDIFFRPPTPRQGERVGAWWLTPLECPFWSDNFG